jgi:plasmid stability protein
LEELMATLNLKNLPEPLYRKLRVKAKSERRSMAQQAIQILSESLDRTDALSIADLQGLGKECWTGLEASVHVDDERRSWD